MCAELKKNYLCNYIQILHYKWIWFEIQEGRKGGAATSERGKDKNK
jgi:hypothetical protein